MTRFQSRIKPLGPLMLLVVTMSVAGCSKSGDESKGDTSVAKHQNRLANEKSPYLLQHADNPVDWYPWGEEAFAKAKAEDKPIFLSIGYSTCHWCHVMEHESFEDSTVAALMNDAFVNIKVDREERPDIDNIYMMVAQMITGSGGWPLTIVMTPDGKPFFAATYIPKEDRYGRVGMIGLIPQLVDAWKTKRSDVYSSSEQITEKLQNYASRSPSGAVLNLKTLEDAYTQFSKRFDDTNGGFGGAPKFPTPHTLLFLLRYWKRTGTEQALNMVVRTLEKMAQGGIYDHVGYGFHRYSTDARWFAPHFEKMLYDQALLIIAYSEAYLATGRPDFRRIAGEIIHYVARDMTSPDGGFYSAEDADSEGIEGKFYLWSQEQLRDLLSPEDAELMIDLYGTTPRGNFHEEVPGGNILYLRHPMGVIAQEMKMSEDDLRARLEPIRETLFEEREKRIHPHKDDKILADWNGLMIAAMAIAGRSLDEPKYAAYAEKAADFVLNNMRDREGRLLHRYRDGSAGIAPHIEDYAFMVWGLVELYENTFDIGYLKTAIDMNKYMIDNYWDDAGGGLFFTPDDGEELIVRMKEVYDGAIPSGNSVAMRNLLRLGRITADPELEDYANRIGIAFHEDVSRQPSQFSMLLLGLDFGLGPSYEVVIVGDPKSEDTEKMKRALNRAYVPNKVVVLKSTQDAKPEISELAAYTESQQAIEGKATAYVCKNYACELPTTSTEKMLEMLNPPAQ